MAFIEISNLDAADSNSSTSANSFLTELEKTDTVQISGGSRGRSRRTAVYCCWYTPPCEPDILLPDTSRGGGGGGGGRGNGGGGGRGNGGGGGR